MSSQALIPSPPSPQVIVPQSLRIGQYFTVILGFGLSTLAIAARLYTKLRITRKFLSEDCKPCQATFTSFYEMY